MLVYTARFVLPVSDDAIADGAVAVDGDRLVRCGPRREVLDNVGPDVEVRNLGASIVMPGLVNCHAHLELSWMGQDPPPGGDYVSWVRELIRRRADEDLERACGSAAAAARQMLARGTVAVGDVANQTWIAPILARCGLYGVVFHELLGLNGAEAAAQLAAAEQRLMRLRGDTALTAAADRVRLALTPHAPHTTSAPLLRALARWAESNDLPLSIHVAESRDEAAWLRDGSGALAELFEERGFAEPGWRPPGLPPVCYLDALGVLGPGTLAVHCVQLRASEREILRARGATVVVCLRSNLRLGVGRPAIPELVDDGVPVALGTDSLASAPDLDLFAEMAALCEAFPDLAPATIVRMATLNGARALGLDQRLGSLQPGRLARLIVIPLPRDDDDPARVACSNPPSVTWLADARWEPMA